jgi:hypothetical protein
MTTGQVFVRDTGVEKQGKRVMMLFAVVAVDDDGVLVPESKYTITGDTTGLKLEILSETEEPMPEFEASPIDAVIMGRHWRV